MESHDGMILTGRNRRAQRETCLRTTSFATNPIWTESGANPGLRSNRPAANRLSHGTACHVSLNNNDCVTLKIGEIFPVMTSLLADTPDLS
jgi:hypothetical protein